MTARQKTILISGAMGGVGRAITTLFLKHGYSIVLLYRNATEIELTRKHKQLGEKAFFVQCDVSDIRQVQSALTQVLRHTQTIDMCVHAAAGKITRKRLAHMTEEEFRSEFEAGVFGAFNLFSSVVPLMQKNGKGMLIGITSTVVGSGGGAQMGAYTTAKYALRGLLREFDRELRAEGIGVYAVAPDLLKTKLTADLPDKYFEFAVKQAHRKKLSTPLDVAKAVLRIAQGKVRPGSSFLVSSGEVSQL